MLTYQLCCFIFILQCSLRPVFSFEWDEAPSNCFVINEPSTNLVVNTLKIQEALKHHSCVALEPNPTTHQGDYPISTILLPSNSLLHLGSGVRLLAVIGTTYRALILVENAHNVTLEGHGMLYGSAEHAFRNYNHYDNRFEPLYKDGSPFRPNDLLVVNSSNILVRGISLHNSSGWTFRMDNSDDIWVDSVDIYGDSRFPNNDGFDPESCRNVTLVNSHIDVADDGICPKAASGMGPLDRLTVRNCTVRSKSHAIKFGSNTDTNMTNVVFDNITIWDSNAGLSIQQRSAGTLHNITFSNIQVETRYQAGRWWGNGEWLSVTRTARRPGDVVGEVHNLKFINITARSENGGLLSGFPNHGIDHVLFHNVQLLITAWSNYSRHPQLCCATGRPPWNATALFKNDSTISCLGSRDYRPVDGVSPLDCPLGHGRVAGVADGIFAEHVDGLVLENVTVQFSEPRKPWFGECIRTDTRHDRINQPDSNAPAVVRPNVRCINGPTNSDGESSMLE